MSCTAKTSCTSPIFTCHVFPNVMLRDSNFLQSAHQLAAECIGCRRICSCLPLFLARHVARDLTRPMICWVPAELRHYAEHCWTLRLIAVQLWRCHSVAWQFFTDPATKVTALGIVTVGHGALTPQGADLKFNWAVTTPNATHLRINGAGKPKNKGWMPIHASCIAAARLLLGSIKFFSPKLLHGQLVASRI